MKKETKSLHPLTVFSHYYPLVIGLFFGFIVSLIPVPSDISDNLPVCQGTAKSTGVVRLGGRVITPTNLLLSANGQNCSSGEIPLSLVSLSRTLVVSPKGTPVQNGAALLSAMTSISNASPSASNSLLLKLEPGMYDLGSNSLTLMPYVDLEGSGEDTTLISSTVGTLFYPPTTGTLVTGSNSEIRNLTILNFGNSSFQVALNVPSDTGNSRLIHLTVSVAGATGSGNIGIFNNGMTLSVQDSTLSAIGTGADNTGFYNNAGTSTIKSTTIRAQGGTGFNNIGLFDHSGTAIVHNSNLSAQGSTGSNNTGLLNTGIVTVTNSIITASGGSSSYGLSNSGVMASVGASQLSGATAASSGLNKCPASYNGNFIPLDPTICH